MLKKKKKKRIELRNLQIVRTQNTMQVSLVVISLDVATAVNIAHHSNLRNGTISLTEI